MAISATNSDPRKIANSPAIELDDYYDKIHRTTWIRRVAGMMSGITIFGTLGAVGGVIASFVPYALGALGVAGASAVALPGAAAIATSAALFAGAFALFGMVVGTDVGSNAGSIATGLWRKENREALENGKEITPATRVKNERIIWMPRVALFTTPMGAAFGALLAAGGLAPAVALMGFGAGTAAATIASAVTFGLLGTTIGFNTPMFSSKLNSFYSRLITDRVLVPDPTRLVESSIDKQIPLEIEDVEPRQGKIFASDKLRSSSIKDIIKREKIGDPIPLSPEL